MIGHGIEHFKGFVNVVKVISNTFIFIINKAPKNIVFNGTSAYIQKTLITIITIFRI